MIFRSICTILIKFVHNLAFIIREMLTNHSSGAKKQVFGEKVMTIENLRENYYN
jgi:hypothetical protein